MAAGQTAPLSQPYNGATDDGSLTTPRSPTAVLAFCRQQIALSDAVLSELDLDAAPAAASEDDHWDPEFTDLRWIILHLIEETARRAGHLDNPNVNDVPRHLCTVSRDITIDSRVGLGP